VYVPGSRYIIGTMAISASLFAALALIGGLSAQEQQEPEATDQFFFFVSPGQFKPLEQQTPTHSNGIVFEGNRSTLRFVQGEPLAFVIRLTHENVEPDSAVRFFRLKPQAKYRVLEKISLPLEFTKYDKFSFKIKPKSELGAGEYALSVVGKKDFYCFGVDGVSKSLK
jgi:hypothetical protein